jgi:hypothetical protein
MVGSFWAEAEKQMQRHSSQHNLIRCSFHQDKRNHLIIAIVLIPAVPDISHNQEWAEGQVNDAGIKAFGGLFTQLLGRFGADGTLRRQPGGKCRKEKEQYEDVAPLFHDHRFH